MEINDAYLVCRACGKSMTLARSFFHNPWFTPSSDKQKMRELYLFLKEHSFCHDNDELDLTDEERMYIEERPFALRYKEDILIEKVKLDCFEKDMKEDARTQETIAYKGEHPYMDGFFHGVKWMARRLSDMHIHEAVDCLASLCNDNKKQ